MKNNLVQSALLGFSLVIPPKIIKVMVIKFLKLNFGRQEGGLSKTKKKNVCGSTFQNLTAIECCVYLFL
jgi:hypothetical protein